MPAQKGERMACRTCKAEVIFLAHDKTGRLAPIELEPRPNGRFKVDLDNLTYTTHYGMVGSGDVLHENHYATCPHAQIWTTTKERKRTTT